MMVVYFLHLDNLFETIFSHYSTNQFENVGNLDTLTHRLDMQVIYHNFSSRLNMFRPVFEESSYIPPGSLRFFFWKLTYNEGIGTLFF